jgi:adenylate cyclase
VDPSGDGGGGLTATGLFCGSCGAQSSPTAKFCGECGARLTQATQSAEYKQVTVLFADVVHSMDIAAAVGAERLREIMAELADRCAAVVQRYGGTVDKFTGDGIMAVFGAPVALEDHAVRACLAGLAIQDAAKQLAVGVHDRDGVELWLRVGLNSGQVIAGEIGSGAFGYTTIGEQVGMAQRMESVAPPGGVMLSDSTARLVDAAAVIGEPERVEIKGSSELVPAHQLVAVASRPVGIGRFDTTLVGRDWELNTVAGILVRSIGGKGCVVGVAGPAGIGKSRLALEAAALARGRGVDVFWTFCESHASDVPFHVVARMLRDATGIVGLDDEPARTRIREGFSDAADADVLLLYDLLGVSDSAVPLPAIEPDARRRRLTALINSVSLARAEPALYIIEDVHWIDEVSESMFADFLAVIPQTHSTTLITYRPEYHGALARVLGAQTISLAPLSDSETRALLDEVLGPDESIGAIRSVIVERAAGSPFFAQEMVRELAERGVLEGDRGGYVCRRDVAEVSVPATVQAAIAGRIDRLDTSAKRTLNAAAVIGSLFTADHLTTLGIDPVLDELVNAEMIDQVRFAPYAEYAFRHPLIRAVAYESQLKSDRAQLHRRVATTIQDEDQNAALIAEHLEAAGDFHGAFDWHMRAADWSYRRDVAAAHRSWRRARQVADQLSDDDPQRSSMRIAPRTLLVGTAWRLIGSRLNLGFDELRELCIAAGDLPSLAIGMAGLVSAHSINRRDSREVSRLASELIELLESIDDATLTVSLSYATMIAKLWAGETLEVLRLAQLVIDLAEGDATKGDLVAGSPLSFGFAMRGVARYCLGSSGWKDDLQKALAMAVDVGELLAKVGIMNWVYLEPILNGIALADAVVLRDTAQVLTATEQLGDDFQVVLARLMRAITLTHQEAPERQAGFEMLMALREDARHEQFANPGLIPLIDIYIARENAHCGDIVGAIELSRDVIGRLSATGTTVWNGPVTSVLVEALLRRGGESELRSATAAIDRLATIPTDSGFVLHDVWLLRLRALLARAQGNEAEYRGYRDRYRAMARSLGFEGHIAWAEAMP